MLIEITACQSWHVFLRHSVPVHEHQLKLGETKTQKLQVGQSNDRNYIPHYISPVYILTLVSLNGHAVIALRA